MYAAIYADLTEIHSVLGYINGLFLPVMSSSAAHRICSMCLNPCRHQTPTRCTAQGSASGSSKLSTHQTGKWIQVAVQIIKGVRKHPNLHKTYQDIFFTQVQTQFSLNNQNDIFCNINCIIMRSSPFMQSSNSLSRQLLSWQRHIKKIFHILSQCCNMLKKRGNRPEQ